MDDIDMKIFRVEFYKLLPMSQEKLGGVALGFGRDGDTGVVLFRVVDRLLAAGEIELRDDGLLHEVTT
jgi:hypothetical protein